MAEYSLMLFGKSIPQECTKRFTSSDFTNLIGNWVITVEPGSIASFNLETENWMTLQGPEQK
ncbi:hypothetical protein E2562_014629 [Oryza meyeriana var. granulata]|uniref:Uncharacterized protein n=1 Tax=Oryza meyeriana var. granulata TaxID=110450 RepID=A0A6G1D2T5_9ORYZ|nr:hypothetical protein E2562_014629 [Oryza meyeriana var. granulata]